MGQILRNIGDDEARFPGKFYIATCDQFDDSHTGWHGTEKEAEDAFWSENHFTEEEAKRIVIYTDTLESPTVSEVASEAEWAGRCGYESAAEAIVEAALGGREPDKETIAEALNELVWRISQAASSPTRISKLIAFPGIRA